MKRIVTLLLAAGLVLGAAAGSQAADIKAKGTWEFGFEFSDRTFQKHDGEDTFKAQQRLRTQIDVIASESLKGVVFLEMGHTNWGNAKQGGALGTDGKEVEVRYSYVDWVIPQTDAKVRMGLQPFALPDFTVGNPILGGGNAQGAGVIVSGDFSENVGASLFWLRAENDNVGSWEDAKGGMHRFSDEMDFIGLTVPLTFDGVKVTPWAMYGSIGRDSFPTAGYNADNYPTYNNNKPWNNSRGASMAAGLLPASSVPELSTDTRANAWWIGFGGEVTAFAPFRVALDAAYGSVDMGQERGSKELRGKEFDIKRSGWYTSLLAEYKLDVVTPGLLFWYSSGDDSNGWDGSERLPTIQGSWAPTSYGFDAAVYNTANCLVSETLNGTWGVTLQLKDISFMEDLSHVFRVAYYAGTNNKAMAEKGWVSSPWDDQNATGTGLYLTTKDHAWEVNFDTQYNIYKDLTLVLELGYINLKIDEDVWGLNSNDIRKNNFKAGVNLTYAF